MAKEFEKRRKKIEERRRKKEEARKKELASKKLFFLPVQATPLLALVKKVKKFKRTDFLTGRKITNNTEVKNML